jgi:hydrogenase/urease accessory protein HupE
VKAILRALWLACIWLAGAPAGYAHALEPGYLEISPISGATYRVFWRIPDVSGRPMPIEARLPESCTERLPPSPRHDGTAWIAPWTSDCPGGLRGAEISIIGLENTRTDVLVRYELEEGQIRTERLTPARPAFKVAEDPGAFSVLGTYVPLGVKHILEGFDHLLFVFALLLLIPDRWRLFGAITAFTVAHSITMAVATLGLVTLPGPPVEAVIALSIMFVASELVLRRDGAPRLSERNPWIVSFSFGLLHGFGFAGALKEIGLPDTDIPLALLSFNLGVELGQLVFVSVVLAIGLALAFVAPKLRRLLISPGTRTSVTTAYGIGGIAAFWFVERVTGFLS